MTRSRGLKQAKTIAFLLDERLSREKSHILMRSAHALRRLARVDILKPGLSEAELIEKISSAPYDLVLVPWYRYLVWKKLDGHFGKNRLEGPTVAGYFADQVLPYELGETQGDRVQCILLDFSNLKSHETTALVGALLEPESRSGLKPLLQTAPKIYYENWISGQGLGYRTDVIQSLDDLARHEWKARANAIRYLLGALWGLIYEEGPGRIDYVNMAESKMPRGYFQIASDEMMLLMRLCYTRKGMSYCDLVHQFWPQADKPTHAAQILLKYGDFLRVHPFSDGQTIEVTVGLMKSQPSLQSHAEMHTLWVEPLSKRLLIEEPFETKSHTHRHLEPLPEVPLPPNRVGTLEAQLRAKERQVQDLHEKVHALKQDSREKDELIQELRRGGVGTHRGTPQKPEMNQLIEAFQLRYLEARREIMVLESAIREAEEQGADSTILDSLQRRAKALIEQEQGWISKLAQVIKIYKENAVERKKSVG